MVVWRMSGGCLMSLHLVSWGCLVNVRKVYLEDVWSVFWMSKERCLQGVCKVSGRCPQGSERFLWGVWKVSRRCLQALGQDCSSKPFIHPKFPWTHIFLISKIFPAPKFYWNEHFFWSSKCFGNKDFFGSKLLLESEIFLLFSDPNCFNPRFFRLWIFGSIFFDPVYQDKYWILNFNTIPFLMQHMPKWTWHGISTLALARV